MHSTIVVMAQFICLTVAKRFCQLIIQFYCRKKSEFEKQTSVLHLFLSGWEDKTLTVPFK